MFAKIKLYLLLLIVLNSVAATAQGVTPEQKREAEQFFQEALRLRNLDKTAAWKKLNAALALDPEELKFTDQKLDWEFDEMNKSTILDKYIANFEQHLKNSNPYRIRALRWKLQQGKVEEAWQKTSKGEQQKLAVFCDKFRIEFDKLNRQWNKPEKTAQTLDELYRQKMYFCNSREFALYYDMDKFKQAVRSGALEYLRRTSRFFKNPHPKLKSKRPPEEWIRYNLNLNWCTGRDWFYHGMTYTPDELDEYIIELQRHPLRTVQGMGLLLELYNHTIRSSFQQEAFAGNVKDFCQKFAALKITPINKNDVLKCYFWKERLRKYPKLIKIADKTGKDLIPQWCETPAEKFFKEVKELVYAKGKNPDFTELAQFILNNKKGIIDFDAELQNYVLASQWRVWLAMPMMNCIAKYQDAKARKALAFLNRKMLIQQLFESEYPIPDAILRNNKLYYAYSDFGDTLHIETLDLTTGKCKKLYEYSTKLTTWVKTYSNYHSTGYALDCDDAMLVVGAEDAIHLFRLDGKEGRTITDLPNAYVNAVAIIGKRIYAWLGFASSYAKDKGVGTMLFSCDFEGKDRIIHVHLKGGKYLVKSNEKGLTFPSNIRGMLPGHERKKLYFLNYDSIGVFDTESTNYEEIKLKPPCSQESWEMKAFRTMDDGKLYISFGMDCVVYDMASAKYEWVFSGTPSGKGRAKNYHWDGFNIAGVFYVRPGQIWCNERFIDINASLPKEILYQIPYEEKSRLNIHRIFPCPDGKSVIYLRGRDAYRLTPSNKETTL